MTKQEQKTLATSLTAMVFFVIGTTGILMYFHLLDRYTKELHETLGLAFVIIVFFHIFYNWTSMKNYFGKKLFLISFALVLSISIGFVLNSKDGENPKTKIINLVLNAPIEKSVLILGADIGKIKINLKNQGIVFTDKESIIEIAKNNKISPFKIIDIVTSDNINK